MAYTTKDEAKAAAQRTLLTCPKLSPMVVMEWPPEQPVSWTFITQSLADLAGIPYSNDEVVNAQPEG